MKVLVAVVFSLLLLRGAHAQNIEGNWRLAAQKGDPEGRVVYKIIRDGKWQDTVVAPAAGKVLSQIGGTCVYRIPRTERDYWGKTHALSPEYIEVILSRSDANKTLTNIALKYVGIKFSPTDHLQMARLSSNGRTGVRLIYQRVPDDSVPENARLK